MIKCYICHKNIKTKDLPKRINGEVRKDAFGNYWCKECTNAHVNIDWEEIDNKAFNLTKTQGQFL